MVASVSQSVYHHEDPLFGKGFGQVDRYKDADSISRSSLEYQESCMIDDLVGHDSTV